jgi:glycosyltransferase involved in cell wall biosynthesis
VTVSSPIVVAGPHCGLRQDSNLGGEIYERALLERLPRYGVKLELGLPASRPVVDPPEGWEVALLRPTRGQRWYFAPLTFVPYVTRVLREKRVDLLRGHSVRFTGPSLFVGRRIAGAKVPIVLHHLHTDPRWERLDHELLRRADAVVTISNASRRQLLNAGIEHERIHVVYPGVSQPDSITPRTEAWPRNGALRVLYVGRLIERKRPGVAVAAVAGAVARGLDASLVVAGSGPLGKRLLRLAAERGLDRRLRWIGAPTDEEKWGLYAAADVLLVPSGLEGFGFVAAEAQAAGTPVVAVSGTGVAEVVVDGESGLVVPPAEHAFVSALERLSDPALRGRMAERSRELSRRFDWDDCARRVADVYRRVVERSRDQ